MKKIIKGITEFRRNSQDEYLKQFGHLTTGQSPKTLFITCSDSRLVPSIFTATDPGDLFSVRNVGNLVPPNTDEIENSDDSVGAAIEYSLAVLEVPNIIVCGHSECGAMKALLGDRNKLESQNLKSWLRHGDSSLKRATASENISFPTGLEEHNRLSQVNVLQQMENLKTYPEVESRIKQGKLQLHGWWFDIKQAETFSFSEIENKFILME